MEIYFSINCIHKTFVFRILTVDILIHFLTHWNITLILVNISNIQYLLRCRCYMIF